MRELRWSMIKRIANSGYARLTILVPVIGWLLIADNVFLKAIAKYTGEPSFSQPSWKAYALHAGLSIFGVGIGLYYLICPTIIKTYRDFNEFAEADRRTITSDQLGKYNSELQHGGVTPPSSTVTGPQSLAFPQGGSETGRDVWQQRNADLILKTQFAYYELKDKESFWYKIFILSIVGPGALLTFIPSLMTIISSFVHLYKSAIAQIF